MTMREVIFDTNVNPLLVVGRDEDTCVRLKGACDSVIVQLPSTTTVGRTIVIEDGVDYRPAIKVRTANYGADNLRVVTLIAAGSERSRAMFVFVDKGYWHYRQGDGAGASPVG
jgi:hypothetical protein